MSQNAFTGQTGIGPKLALRIVILGGIAIGVIFVLLILAVRGTWNERLKSLDGASIQSAQVWDEILGSMQSDLRATRDALVVADSEISNDALMEIAPVFFLWALDRQPMWTELLLIAPDNRILADLHRSDAGQHTSQADLPEMSVEIANQPWLDVVKAGGLYVGTAVDEAADRLLLDMALAVNESENSTFKATLLVKVDILPLLEQWSAVRVGKMGYTYIVDRQGKLLLHPDVTLLRPSTQYPEGRALSDLITRSPREVAETNFNLYQGFASSGEAGKYVLAAGAPLQNQMGYALAEWPLGEAVRPLWQRAGIVALLIVVSGGALRHTIRFVRRRISMPLSLVRDGAVALRTERLYHRINLLQISTESDDELRVTALALNDMAAQVQRTITDLERQVADNTRILRAAKEISEATATILDPDELISRTVDLICERFALYYVGLFLVDEIGEYAVLRAGTGEAGAQMLAHHHQLRVGGTSMIGRCVARGEPRIALYVGEEALRYNNPLLPDTQSEMALPLRSRGRVIGAMTVQSVDASAFSEANISVMQTMADQVAASIDNAQLYTQAQTALAEMSALQQRYQGQAWAKFMQLNELYGYEKTKSGMTHLGEVWLPEARRAIAGQKLVILPDGEVESESDVHSSTLVVPIKLREQPIGVLGLKREQQEWREADIALIETIVQQFAQAADNLRLLDETTRRAARERLVSQVSGRIRETLDVELVLQTTVQEMRQILDLAEAEVRVGAVIAE
ncbi:MAG: GAF domain-containing protein [Anaerolineae bacterium]|nr:GAF domain-containing protein [Anaerolineae bacterium]